MHTDLPSLPELERQMAAPGADHVAIARQIRAVANELSLLRVDAEIALDGDLHDDLRPALLAYLASVAHLHGRSHKQQLAVFLADGDDLFAALMFRALGVALC